MPPREIEILLRELDQAFDHKAWHGTNLRGSIRGLSAREASHRPAPGRHNIWEVTVHCAYWKYAVWRGLLGEKRGSFAEKGSNWFVRPDGRASESAWKRDVLLLEAMHQRLRAAISSLTSRDLPRRFVRGKYSILDTVLGIASHDLYHAGQIQLLKRFARLRKRRRGV